MYERRSSRLWQASSVAVLVILLAFAACWCCCQGGRKRPDHRRLPDMRKSVSSKRRSGHAKHAADSDSSLEDEDDDDDDLFDRLKDDFDRLKQENLPPPPKSVKLHVFVVVGQAYHRKMVKLRCDLAQLSDLHAEIDAIFVPELSPSGQRVADLEMQYLDSVTGQPVLFQSAATADAAAEQIAAVLRSSAILLSDRPIAELVARARDAPAGASQAGEAAGGIRLAAMASRPKSKKQLSGGRGRKLLVDGSSSEPSPVAKPTDEGEGEISIWTWVKRQEAAAEVTGSKPVWWRRVGGSQATQSGCIWPPLQCKLSGHTWRRFSRLRAANGLTWSSRAG